MQFFPAALQNLSDQFAKLPGIGGKTAQRLAFHILKQSDQEAKQLANAIVKQAKPSEKAYICLKAAWLIRGKAEHLNVKDSNFTQQKKECEDAENEFLRNAMEGFLAARQSEGYPMCGMDECTVDYLIAVTAMRFDQYDVASKLVSSILVSSVANPRMKEKARDLKEMLMIKIKEQKMGK